MKQRKHQDWRTYTGNSSDILLSDKELLALWFVELPTTDTGKDWIDEVYIEIYWNNIHNNGQDSFRKAIEKFMPQPKPVDQVLIPLDVSVITKEIVDWMINWDISRNVSSEKRDSAIKSILSKYWVHKQEEETVKYDIAWFQLFKNQWKEPLAIPITSTMEELADKIDNMVHHYMTKDWFSSLGYKNRFDKEDIKQLLLASLTPMGKKLTKSSVSERLVKSWRVSHNEEENKWLQVLRDFLEEKHLLQE